jgi:hypothetical protein
LRRKRLGLDTRRPFFRGERQEEIPSEVIRIGSFLSLESAGRFDSIPVAAVSVLSTFAGTLRCLSAINPETQRAQPRAGGGDAGGIQRPSRLPKHLGSRGAIPALRSCAALHGCRRCFSFRMVAGWAEKRTPRRDWQAACAEPACGGVSLPPCE